MKNTGGVAVDEGGRHADEQFGYPIQLGHGVALAAGVVVLVQLIGEETADAAAHFLFDVRA